MELLVIAAVALTALLLAVMIAKRKKLFPDKFLILYLATAFFSQWLVYFQTKDEFQHSYWMLLAKGVYLLDPCLFFLYVYCLAKQKLPSRLQLTVLFAPFVSYVLNFFYHYLFVFGKSTVAVDRGILFIDDKVSIPWLIFVSMFMLIQPAVLGCFYFILREYKNAVHRSVSHIETLHFNWLNVLFYLWLITALILVPISFFALTTKLFSTTTLEFLIEVFTVAFYFIVGFFGFRQTVVFTDLEFTQPLQKPSPDSYQRSGLSVAMSRELHVRLLQLMDAEKPYLNRELTARELATLLGISNNHLSQVLNMEQKQNFFDFVNSYRVGEVVARMNDLRNAHLTLLAIALDSGFNSKTSFNDVFKKFMKVSPSQYYKNLKG